MRELIRHILKENRIQQELKQVIKNSNIFDAADMVGGVENLKRIFKGDPEFSSLFEKLTGTIIFYYIGYLQFPLEYEIIGRRSNIHNTNHWPVINVIYDENKLTPKENEVFKEMIYYLVDEAQHSGFESKFEDSRLFNANYFTIKEINGQDIDSIDYGYDFSNEDFDVKNIHDKLYGESESLNESSNRNEKDTQKLFKIVKMIMEDLILPEYNHLICSYEITLNEVFNIPEVTVLFIGGYGTKLWPMTQGIRNMYIEVLDDISKEIANYTGVVIGVRGEQTPKCEDKENIYLRESENKSEDKKLNLVKEMIYSLFDEVEFIEVDTNYGGKPLIKVYHDVEDTAANYDNWFAHKIQDEIKEMTGDSIILSPWWALGWDWKYKNVDFYINVQKLKYDNLGNVINESENKKERKFNRLIQKVEDYLNSNEYPSVKKFTVYYEDTHDDVIVNIFFDAEDSIRLGGGINSVIKRVGKQVMEDLEVFPMDFKYYIHFDRDINESTEKQPKYLNIIKDLVEPFKDEDCVCDITVLYNEEDDMYLIDLNLGTEELNDKFIAVIGMNHYVSKLRRDIKETIKDYLPIDNFYVGSYASQKCNSKSLNESSIKEKSLVKLIEKDGLYNFIEMSGLDFNQVKSILNKMDNPKEILKQYIREFVLEHDGMSSENSGSLFGLKIRLSNTKLIYDIMVQDSDQIAFEIWEFYEDNYGQRITKDQYLTTINSLTNEELLSILSWMMETIQIGYWD